jgi:hypothetical protein
MKAVSFVFACLALIVLIAPLRAQDAAKKKAAKKTPAPLAAIEKQLASLDLSADQKQKVDDILAKYRDQFAAAQTKMPKLSKEQRQAQKEAAEKAKAEGKKGKEQKDAVDAALNLTEEQKKDRQESQATMKELQASLKKDLTGVLTAEQAAKLAPPKRKKKAA